MVTNSIDIENDKENPQDYEIEPDTEFTLDEIESIKRYKSNLETKLNRNQAILRGLEASFWSISSYSLARFLIVTSGTQGMALAVALVFGINQIVHRSLLNFTLDKTDNGLQILGMHKLINFLFQLLLSAFICWSAIGDYFQTVKQSEKTYESLKTAIQDFQKMPESDKNNFFILAGLVIAGAGYVIVKDRR